MLPFRSMLAVKIDHLAVEKPVGNGGLFYLGMSSSKREPQSRAGTRSTVFGFCNRTGVTDALTLFPCKYCARGGIHLWGSPTDGREE